jgi:hypothetical protein
MKISCIELWCKYKKETILTLFFGLYLGIGLSIFPDYGMYWDDMTSRDNGAINFKYIAEKWFSYIPPELVSLPNLSDWKDKDYGVAFELPVYALERLLRISTDRNIYVFRHLMVFLIFFAGSVAVYATAAKRHGDYRIGLLAALLLVTSPRLFGESFYNTKDIVFLAGIAISTYTGLALFSEPKVSKALAHAFASAFTIDVRIMGIVVIAITLGLLALLVLRNQKSWRYTTYILLFYFFGTAIFTVLMFPWLWDSPLENFGLAFRNMAKFRLEIDMLYFGSLVKSNELPWHYAPAWIFLTTPPVILIFFILGCWPTLKNALLSLQCCSANIVRSQDAWHFAMFVLPLVAVIGMKSVLYDGWRQLYFVYPALIYIATNGFVFVWRRLGTEVTNRLIIASILLFSIGANIFFIFQAHPIQNVYFNALAGKNLKEKFELDYWGLGNLSAINFILENDTSQNITLASDSYTPLINSIAMLSESERKRIKLVDRDSKPKYILNNYRLTQVRDDSYGPEYKLFYVLRAGSESVLSVYELANWAEHAERSRPLSVEEFSRIKLKVKSASRTTDGVVVALELTNDSSRTLSADKANAYPIRLSTRLIDANQQPTTGWQSRFQIRDDVPSASRLNLELFVSIPEGIQITAIEISFVQEGIFWAHDVGTPPLVLEIK